MSVWLFVLKDIANCCTDIWFSFTVKVLIGPGKVYSYLVRWYQHPPKRNRQKKALVLSKVDLCIGHARVLGYFTLCQK